MAYTSISADNSEPVVKATERLSGDLGSASVIALELNNSVRTEIRLDRSLAKAVGFRATSRVSVQVGTGRDKGKIRIVANPEGGIKIQDRHAAETVNKRNTNSSLLVRTSRLLETPTARREARIVSAAKGVLTLAI